MNGLGEIGTYGLLPVRVLAAVLAFVLTCRLFAKQGRRQILAACDEAMRFLKSHCREDGWYQKRKAWLIRMGAAFHFSKEFRVETYAMLCIGAGICGFLIGMLQSWWLALGLGAGLCFAPRLLIRVMNMRDNEKMLSEIKLVYHALEMQIRAGVYVTDALAECYGSVQNRRLKQALLDLAGDITMRADITEALDSFRGKFDNRYIDALCVTILQALESGQAVELLGDIAEQVKDMESAVLGRRKNALDRSITLYQLGILAAMLGMVIYACITEMFAAALFSG